MRIQDSAYVVDLSRTGAANENEAGSITSRARQERRNSFDRIDVSTCGPGLQDLEAQFDALPDLRLDRVALARQKLQGDGYDVAPALVAQKMMKVAVIFS